MFSKLALTAVVSALLAAATAIPTPEAGGMCNTGELKCCNTFGQSSDPTVTKGLPSLLQVVLSGLDVPIGVNCDPITAIGASLSSSCKAQPVCCSDNSTGSLVSIGCVPVSL